jgi:glucokinase
MTLSTGIGGGIVSGGRLYRGASGNAGELGHLVVCAGGRACKCGGRGCLETYCSGSNIAERAVEAMARDGAAGKKTELASLGRDPRAEDVIAAAVRGDSLATPLWHETLDLLAAGLVSVVHAFEPRRIVLGGGLTRAGDTLFIPLVEKVRASTMAHFRAGIDIVPAALGDQVGVLGAAAVALARLEEQERKPGRLHPDGGG